jgi:Arc/MetJ-type ribon-helix-helix transcriptional regulator
MEVGDRRLIRASERSVDIPSVRPDNEGTPSPEGLIMQPAFSPEIQRLIDENLSTGHYSSPEEVIHAALHALSAYHATIADVRQGLIDHKQGAGEPLSKAMADIRGELSARQ